MYCAGHLYSQGLTAWTVVKREIDISFRSVFPTESIEWELKVAPYSFMTARALMMRASVICARSNENAPVMF